MLGDLSQNQIEYFLRSQLVGRLGYYNGSEVTITPVTYVYDGTYIYAHSKEGEKVQVMRENPNVCFQVDEIDNMTNWRSVIAWGKYEELTEESAQKSGMKIMEDRLTPFTISETVRPSQGTSSPPEILEKGRKAMVYRIKIKRYSGKFEKT